MPFPEDESLRSDLRHQPPQRANNKVCSAGSPPKIESLRTRFDSRLVGFGIISPSTRAPNVKEHLSRNCKPQKNPAAEIWRIGTEHFV